MIFKPPKAFKPVIPDFAHKMVSFQFDDGNMSDYDRAFAYLISKGIKPSMTSNINTGTLGQPGWLTWEQFITMRNEGWSFQCHLHSHYKGTDLTPEKLHEQFQLVNKSFYERGCPPPKYHVYPFGLWSPATRDIGLQYREVMVLDGVPGTNTTAFLNKKIKFKGSYGDIRTEAHFDLRKSEIEEVLSGTYDWITFLGHAVMDVADPERDYGYTTAYFQAFIDYVVSRGMKIVSIEHGHMIQKMIETRYPQTFNWRLPVA